MKRLAVILLLAFAVAPLSAADAKPPRAQLRHFLCQQALAPADRAISVEAVMRPVNGTRRMAIRFQLVSRAAPGGPSSLVRGGDLGSWLTPVDPPTLGQRPGDVWLISHPVTGLRLLAAYHYRVTFRWSGARGHVLATATRFTSSCSQRDLRPDLRVTSLTVEPIVGHPLQARYTALIANRGETGSGPFQIVFAPAGGAAAKTRTVPGLAPHTAQAESFIGPACTALSAPTVTVDPNHQVNDLHPARNSLTVPASCPASTGP